MRPHSRSGIALLAITILLAGCSAPNPVSPAPTLIAPARAWYDETDVHATGKVMPARQVDLSFPLSGLIASWSIKEGDRVHQGAVLARLDTTILEDEVAQAEAALAVSQANLEAAVARTEPDLLAFPGSAAIARAEVVHAQSIVDEAKAHLAQATLVAPMDGVVTAIYADQYEYAPEGKPVMQISDMSNLQVKVEIDEADSAAIAAGNTATVTFGGAPGTQASGVVTRIAPQIGSGDSIKFICVVELYDVPESVHWGMTADILISTQ